MHLQLHKGIYYKYSDYLFNRYGEKVYKIPISVPSTCPNRDGKCGKLGCIFCSAVGAGYETKHALSVHEQLTQNIDYIGKRYGAKKFIAYFQDYTATYMSIQLLLEYMKQVLDERVIEICLSTRPDCVADEVLDALVDFSTSHGVALSIELGLQSVNDNTLKIIERGHDLTCFIDAAKRIKTRNIMLGVHLIANLPWDNLDDLKMASQLFNDLSIDNLKIHSLYVLKQTKLAKMYCEGELNICTIDEYYQRIATILIHLNPSIAIQRFFGRAPKDQTLFCNWGRSWRFLYDRLIEYLEIHRIYQGKALRADRAKLDDQ